MFCVISFMECLFYLLEGSFLEFEFLVYYFRHYLIFWDYDVNECNRYHDYVRVHVELSDLSIENY